jgi:hypothetical protein
LEAKHGTKLILENIYFGGKIAGTKVITPKHILVSIIDKDLFRNSFPTIFNDTYQVIGAMTRFQAIKIYKTRKQTFVEFSHSNSADALLVLCNEKYLRAIN